MFSATKAYLEDISTWLLLLKYLGLCLAAGSSIWGILNELTVKPADGKRRPTRPGLVAISFTILGLIISLVSEDLQRRDADNTRKAQIIAEANRTNKIIIAGQPLASLALHWQFASTNAELWQAMTDGEKEIDKNADSEQGGTPIVQYEVEQY